MSQVALFVIGQSNETGQGLTAGANLGAGSPVMDPTKPNGQAGKRSWYPSMARELGKNGINLAVYNYALGGSGLVYCWAGCITTWSSGMLVKKGMYAKSSDGGLWRANVASTVSGPAAANEPSGTSDATGADTIPWVYIGLASAYENGVVSRSSALFDPMGQLSAVKSAAQGYTGGKRVLMVSFGQTDATMSYPGNGAKVTRALYSAALQEVALWAAESGVFDVVLLGHSFSGDGTMNGYYTSTIVPGLEDAIAATASNSKIKPGVNLYAALGALTVNDASGNGLQADGLHAQDNVYESAGVHHAARILEVI